MVAEDGGRATQSLMALAAGLLPPGLDAEKFGVPEVAKYGLGEEAKALGEWARPKGACFDTEEIQRAMRGEAARGIVSLCVQERGGWIWDGGGNVEGMREECRGMLSQNVGRNARLGESLARVGRERGQRRGPAIGQQRALAPCPLSLRMRSPTHVGSGELAE